MEEVALPFFTALEQLQNRGHVDTEEDVADQSPVQLADALRPLSTKIAKNRQGNLQAVEYLRLTQSMIKGLDRRLLLLETTRLEEPSPVLTAEDKPDLTVFTCKVEYMGWKRFVSPTFNETKENFVIEVLNENVDHLWTDDYLYPTSRPRKQRLLYAGGPNGRIERIRFRSPHILALLEELYEDLDDRSLASARCHIAPFKALLNCEKGIRARFIQLAAQKDEEADKFEHLQCLVNFLDNDLKAQIETHKELSLNTRTKVAFSELWSLCTPGKLLYDPLDDQAWLVLATKGGRSILLIEENQDSDSTISDFCITVVRLDFDGKQVGPVQQDFYVAPYEGQKAITSLPLYPIEHAASPLLQRLTDRGAKYAALSIPGANAYHRDYQGLTLERVREPVDSQIMVDLDWYYTMQTGQKPRIGIYDSEEADAREVQESYTVPDGMKFRTERPGFIYDDRTIDEFLTEQFTNKNKHLCKTYSSTTSQEVLRKDYAYLFPRRIYAFIFRTRTWNALDIDNISKVKPRPQSFQDLVLPPHHRKLVEAVVRTHRRPLDAQLIEEDAGQDDLVRGKGRGTCILLHGLPGTGKTSTAETVAEATGRPLLALTCGDIGEDPAGIQTQLEESFRLAHRWGCVMLLDEADVYLAQRSKDDMKRNAVVSIFLRVLEYYSGILFLTTNRVGTFDEAFKSRIHVSLYYKELSFKQTQAIWKVNLNRISPRLRMDEEKLMRWVKAKWKKDKKETEANGKRYRPWNGRQIRNACQTAAALAEFEGSGELTVQNLKSVAKATENFDRYLYATHGQDDYARATQLGARGDDAYNLGLPHASHMRFTPNVEKKKPKSKKKKRHDSDDDSDESESAEDTEGSESEEDEDDD